MTVPIIPPWKDSTGRPYGEYLGQLPLTPPTPGTPNNPGNGSPTGGGLGWENVPLLEPMTPNGSIAFPSLAAGQYELRRRWSQDFAPYGMGRMLCDVEQAGAPGCRLAIYEIISGAPDVVPLFTVPLDVVSAPGETVRGASTPIPVAVAGDRYLGLFIEGGDGSATPVIRFAGYQLMPGMRAVPQTPATCNPGFVAGATPTPTWMYENSVCSYSVITDIDSDPIWTTGNNWMARGGNEAIVADVTAPNGVQVLRMYQPSSGSPFGFVSLGIESDGTSWKYYARLRVRFMPGYFAAFTNPNDDIVQLFTIGNYGGAANRPDRIELEYYQNFIPGFQRAPCLQIRYLTPGGTVYDYVNTGAFLDDGEWWDIVAEFGATVPPPSINPNGFVKFHWRRTDQSNAWASSPSYQFGSHTQPYWLEALAMWWVGGSAPYPIRWVDYDSLQLAAETMMMNPFGVP